MFYQKRHIYILLQNVIILSSIIAFCIGGFIACNHPPKAASHHYRDLQQVKDSRELIALTLYGSTSYYMYRGEEMGFQYELCKQFAQHLHLKLRMEPVYSVDEMIQKLNDGDADLIAYPVHISQENKEHLLFCGYKFVTHQVLIQRNNSKTGIIKDVTQLPGHSVYAKQGKYLTRLENLNDELGGGIDIHPITDDSISIDDLSEMVALKKIDYAVADNDIAAIERTYYPQLNTFLKIGFDQQSSWAVAPGNITLAHAINEWFNEKQTKAIYNLKSFRYFRQSKNRDIHSPILSIKEGKISIFDGLFKKYAKEINWDWKLLASLAYKESNFDTTAVSWAGAKGLMQLMPNTAKKMGVPKGKERNAEESLKGAIKYIQLTEKYFKNIPYPERSKFILAAYNSGIGHIKDAIALTQKYGGNPNKWDNNVSKYMLLKSNPIYFNDEVCKNGYFRGIETYNFVDEICRRYDYYNKVIKN